MVGELFVDDPHLDTLDRDKQKFLSQSKWYLAFDYLPRKESQ
jgi:hypothetical protein